MLKFGEVSSQILRRSKQLTANDWALIIMELRQHFEKIIDGATYVPIGIFSFESQKTLAAIARKPGKSFLSSSPLDYEALYRSFPGNEINEGDSKPVLHNKKVHLWFVTCANAWGIITIYLHNDSPVMVSVNSMDLEKVLQQYPVIALTIYREFESIIQKYQEDLRREHAELAADLKTLDLNMALIAQSQILNNP